MISSKSVKWSKFVSVILVIVMVFSLTACGNSETGANNKDGLIKMNLGYLNVMDDAQTILAHKAGLYEKHGIDATMHLFTSGTDLIKQIETGNIDAGVLGFSNAFSWIDKGSDLKIVGGAQMGYHSMLVHNDSGINTVAQLKGKNVASQKPGSTADIVLNGVVWQNNGLEIGDVTVVTSKPALAIQSLAINKVDGAFVFEPFSSIAKIQYDVKEIYEIGADWPFPCMVVISSGQSIKNNKEAIYKMLDAQKEAIEMLENNPAEAAKYLTEEFIKTETIDKLEGGTVPSLDVIQASIESQQFSWALTEQDIARMDEVAQMMVDRGLMEKKLDVQKALDLSWQKQFE